MARAPRYPSNGDSIHADPLAFIVPAGRTFSVYASDSVEMNGIVSSARNGLLFYDNDRELFLHRPVFTDILTSHQTPTQISVVNEFREICTWSGLKDFFIKLDKVLILEQFSLYLTNSGDPRGREIYFARAGSFCELEGIRLTRAELEAPNSLRRLEMAVAAMPSLKSGFFVDAIPDLRDETPEPMLCRASERRRAERWLRTGKIEKAIPEKVLQKFSRLSEDAAVKEIVEKYMATVEEWEGSPLCKLKGGTQSRADLEDLLIGSQTVFCPSPLGWTPRLRFAFYAPPDFVKEEVEVKIAVIDALERRIEREIGIPVKLLYIPDKNCIVLESIGGGTGGPPITCTFDNGRHCELEILNLSSNGLQSLATTIVTAQQIMTPENMEVEILDAQQRVEEMRAELAQDEDYTQPEEEILTEGSENEFVPEL